jgi:soluble lytic murein transglycosylase-like protein
MQYINDTKKMELELLDLQLAEIDAERDRIQKQVHALKSSLTKAGSTGPWRRAVIAAVSVLAVASLLFIGDFHDAQSNVKKYDQTEATAFSTQESAQIVRAEHRTASGSKLTSRSGKAKTFVARTASQRQWGPSLVMPEPVSKKRYYGFDPVVKEQQENLLTLGFDVGEADGFKGAQTRQAIAEFRALYLPGSGKQLQDADLAVIMEAYAKLARRDAARFGVDHGVIAAIRLSSVRTGVDFSYMMKLAAAESNFEPESESATSSATGMYQFTQGTWLNTLKKHGEKYGLVADYAAKIEYYVNRRTGTQRPFLSDKETYEHLLELRKNPRIAAMMAAETVLDNQQKLVDSFDREPTQTDLYLTHFLGTNAAITFIRSLEQRPDKHAVELFPVAASSNHDVFHPKTCAPRTVDEVYSLFGKKFSTSRYDDLAAY